MKAGARIVFSTLLAVVVSVSAACSNDAPSSDTGPDSANIGGGGTTGGGGAGGGQPNGGSGEGQGTPDSGSKDGGATGVPTVPVTGEINCRTDGDGKTTLVFVNRCARAVTFAGSDITGATLPPGAFACVDVGNDKDPINSKRYWGWPGEDPGPERHTLAEFTFNTDFQDFDWYNISHVDAHNLPMSIVPVDRPKCKTLSCPQDFLASCPEADKVRDSAGEVISCVSPDRNNPNNPVALLFETCDDAYAWSADDANGTDPSPMRACAGEDWDIVFCPPAL